MLEAQILRENRNFANIQVNKQRRYNEILEVLGNKEMTAKEIAIVMCHLGYIPTDERNFTSPRLTELLIKGEVEVVGKKKCDYTGKTVSIFRRRLNENNSL